MSDQYTEEEDKLISWFKENFKNMLIGIIVGISFVLGLNYETFECRHKFLLHNFCFYPLLFS